MRRKRAHPRSLDAQFPRPKKPAVKVCEKGHRQGPNWKRGGYCSSCGREEFLRIRALNADAERAMWSQRLNVGPVLTHLVVSTGKVVRHTIPRQLGRRR